ncbi:MAG TPA: prolyl oligopeptidase family serine peptidase [Bacteroidales bacterium]|nr:prolyl oligopeptidase family serine peptidase [Bacteroidales bacterium]
MKKIWFLAVLLIASISVSAQQYGLQEIVNGVYSSKGIKSVVSAPDGIHYYQMNDRSNALLKYEYETGNVVDTLFSTERARGCTFDTFQGFLVSPDEFRVIVYIDREQIYRRSFKANYYYYDVRRNLVRKLTENDSKQMIPTFSPDGKMLAYVIDNDIWLTKFDFDTESRVTNDGAFNKIINGATDWVYEEEFSTTRLMEFSPDNKLLAFVKTDESRVKEFSFDTFEQELYPGSYTYKYPKAGEENSTVGCYVYDVAAQTTRAMDVPLDDDGYMPRIKFTTDASQLAVMTLNRNQNRFDMYFVNPRSTVSKLILRDESKYYIDSELLSSIHFLPNQFTYISEKDGYSHIYIYGNTGALQKQLTTGSFDVTSLLAVDAASGVVYYQAADESPLQRNIYKATIDRGVVTKLSSNSGYNSATFSNNGKYFINNYTNSVTPTMITLHNSNGKLLRTLQTNEMVAQKVAQANFPAKEFITVPAADGTTQLNGWMIKPSSFDASKRYPVVMIQYSGPNSQQVLDRFGVDWYYALAEEGYIIASVDGRGTGARGEMFRKQTYLNLGVIESDDQIAAAKHFATLPYIDGNRIGIWGWSYGGYNVLMSMSRGGGAFKAGVAIAPVTDWRFYDTVYTERFMRTPQQNKIGYDNGSAIALANKLQGNLLLIHGTTDDNVHLQNSMEYTRALIGANKHFDMFMFPDKNHFISGGNSRMYLYNKVIDYYKRNL